MDEKKKKKRRTPNDSVTSLTPGEDMIEKWHPRKKKDMVEKRETKKKSK